MVAAGREPDQPALVAFRRGDGLVLRMGTPQWTSELNESRLSTEVQDVTKRIWALLSGRCGARPIGLPSRSRRRPLPSFGAMRRRRRLLVGVALVVLALAAASGVYVHNENQPTEKRGSADEEFVTDAAPEPKPPPKKDNPRPWPTYGYDVARTHISPYDHRPPYRRVWSIDAHDTLEFPPTRRLRPRVPGPAEGAVLRAERQDRPGRWRKSTKRCAASSPTIGHKVVYQSYMDFVPCPQGRPGASGFLIAWNAATGRDGGSSRRRRSSRRRCSAAGASTSARGTTTSTP